MKCDCFVTSMKRSHFYAFVSRWSAKTLCFQAVRLECLFVWSDIVIHWTPVMTRLDSVGQRSRSQQPSR